MQSYKLKHQLQEKITETGPWEQWSLRKPNNILTT